MLLRIFFCFFLLCVVNPSVQRKVILAIGDSGLGKSFTARLFGFDAEVSDGFASWRNEVTVYKNDKYIYIDTPGFDHFYGSDNVDDNETINNILYKMQQEGGDITMLHTIFWFVQTDTRATASLQKQAKFIESLTMNSKTSNNVWGNVIIVNKGLSGTFDETVIKDAIKKIERIENNPKLLDNTKIMPVFLHSKLKGDLYLGLSEEGLREFGIYKEKELKDVYEDIMSKKHHADHPVRVVFDATCTKCGIKTDKRLAGRFPCHTSSAIYSHKYDRDMTEEYTYYTEEWHSGSPKTILVKSEIVFGANSFSVINEISIAASGVSVKQRCNKDVDEKHGCNTILNSLKDLGYKVNWKILNCKDFEEQKRCKSCGRVWGNSEGCSHYEKHDFND